jgi:hypothetical protein
MEGGYTVTHSPTRALLVENVWLIDGSLYKARCREILADRPGRLPGFRVDREMESGALCCTYVGNRYFGNWLMDDCPLYMLAADAGLPVTLDRPVSAHMAQYETLLAMAPERIGNSFFRKLLVFDDVGQNRSKRNRFLSMGTLASAGIVHKPRPGVFILRGRHGERRWLVNELEVAEHVRRQHGFNIVDPMTCDVRQVLAACAGAQVVMGVEGSQLVHGLLLLPPGGTLLVLQPPSRFVPLYKHVTDRNDQKFAFVVGTAVATNGDFHISPNEIDQTLALLGR